MSHISNLQLHIPNLLERNILDVGSGRGKFLKWIKELGGNATGIEPCKEYIEMTKDFNVIHGAAENMPFPNESFGFLNISEVIEHCEDPKKLLSEVYRVLEKEGSAYISIPNRFGIRDQHYHLYFINWMPRFLTPYFITEKESGENGRQGLIDMHYFTYWGARKLLKKSGFKIKDTRLAKIPYIFWPFYFLIALWVLDAHHFILNK